MSSSLLPFGMQSNLEVAKRMVRKVVVDGSLLVGASILPLCAPRRPLASAQVLGMPRLHDGPDLEALEQLLITQRPRLFKVASCSHRGDSPDTVPCKNAAPARPQSHAGQSGSQCPNRRAIPPRRCASMACRAAAVSCCSMAISTAACS